MAFPIVVQGLNSFQQANIENAASSVEISYTMDLTSQLTVTLNDPGLQMMSKNYFQVRRPVQFFFSTLEIATVSVQQGAGGDPEVVIECRSRGIQQLKRDRNPESFGATSPSEFAMLAARRNGMRYVGENSPEQLNISQTQYYQNMESSWDVLRRVAGESQFVTFEVDGILVFASQRWLQGKWGNVRCRWPSLPLDAFQLIECPTVRRSDDDPMDAEFQALFMQQNASGLRPGMTIYLEGIPNFTQPFIITEVSWTVDTGLPVSVSGRTPEQYKPKEDPNLAQISYTDGVQEVTEPKDPNAA
jgi:hypothetical protein